MNILDSIKFIVKINFTHFFLLFNGTTAAATKSLQSCPTLCDPIDGSPPGSLVPGILSKNTGVGCHFLLQCRKVKSESETAQSCLTLRNPMDCSPPGSSVHGIFQARVLEWGATVFSEWNYYRKLIMYEDSTIFPLESTVVKSCKHAFIKAVPTLIST